MTETTPPIVLFGATTASGTACLELAAGRPVVVAGRSQPPGWPNDRFLAIDLNEPSLPSPEAFPESALLVSFAPIWLLAPFLAALQDSLAGLGRPFPIAAVVACSCAFAAASRCVGVTVPASCDRPSQPCAPP